MSVTGSGYTIVLGDTELQDKSLEKPGLGVLLHGPIIPVGILIQNPPTEEDNRQVESFITTTVHDPMEREFLIRQYYDAIAEKCQPQALPAAD